MTTLTTPIADTYDEGNHDTGEAPKAEPTGKHCPRCSKELVLRDGAKGPFLACSGYPDCGFTCQPKESPETAEGVTCPDCNSPMWLRHGRADSRFFSCAYFPDCRGTRKAVVDGDNIRPRRDPQPSDIPCPMCGEQMLEHDGNKGPYLRCTIDRCGKVLDIENLRAAGGIKCRACEKPMVRRKGGSKGYFLGCSCYPECRATREIDEPASA
jgi:ssDNA-binding Zn-finger/Zn-ribbon topoisomerase 1